MRVRQTNTVHFSLLFMFFYSPMFAGIQEADIGKDIIEGVPNKLPTLSATMIPKKVTS